jgi:hypothetical protein
MTFGMVEQRKLMIQKVAQMIKDKLPMEREEFLGIVMFETGLTEKKTKEYLKLLFKMKKFTIKEGDGETILNRIDTNGDKNIKE